MADEPEEQERIVAAVGSAAGTGMAKGVGEALTSDEFDHLLDSINERLDAKPDNTIIQLNVTKDSLGKVLDMCAYFIAAISTLEDGLREMPLSDEEHARKTLDRVAEHRSRAADAFALAFDALLKEPGQR